VFHADGRFAAEHTRDFGGSLLFVQLVDFCYGSAVDGLFRYQIVMVGGGSYLVQVGYAQHLMG
jgi:hypothetical protein